MKEKPDSEKNENETDQSNKNMGEEQILMGELEKELKKEILDEGLFILALYIIFMDCDF